MILDYLVIEVCFEDKDLKPEVINQIVLLRWHLTTDILILKTIYDIILSYSSLDRSLFQKQRFETWSD